MISGKRVGLRSCKKTDGEIDNSSYAYYVHLYLPTNSMGGRYVRVYYTFTRPSSGYRAVRRITRAYLGPAADISTAR